MAKICGISKASVQRVWHANRLKPHLLKTFKLSNDPQFIGKLEDVVGLYMNPPDHALVLCIDEKSQIQALDRRQPGLPMKKGRAGTMTHDYKRNGTTTLFAALDVLKGEVIGRCMSQHRHQEFLKFLKAIDRNTPKQLDIHCIADNYATHKKQEVKDWLTKHPRFRFHFIPTSSSWLTLWSAGSRRLPQSVSAAALSQACRNSNAPSTTTSSTTMLTRNLSSGQNLRTTSSSRPTVAERP
jgi:transposase